MVTGWQLDEYTSGGKLVKQWSYYDPVNGDLKTGWQNVDGKWYYFKYSAVKGSREIDGKFYYFDPVNCDMKTGWLVLNGSRYYADPNDGGAFASNKTLIIDGVSYTFDIGGSVINNEP